MNKNEIPQREIDQLAADLDLIKKDEALSKQVRQELADDLGCGLNCLVSDRIPTKIKVNMLQSLKRKIKEVLSGNGKEPLVLEEQAA